MNLHPIVLVLIVIILAVVLFKILKSLLKAVMIAVGVGFLLLLIVGLIAYSDMKQVSTSLEQGNKVLLYRYDGELYTGIFVDNSTKLGIQEDGTLPFSHKSLSKDEMQNYLDAFHGKDFKEDLILVIDHEWLWMNNEEITTLSVKMNEEEFIDIMTSEDPISTLTEQTQIVAPEGSDIKNILFLSSFSSALKENKAQDIITGIQEKKILTAPNLISVGIIKLIPDEAFSNTFKNKFNISRFDLGMPGGQEEQ